MIVTFESEGTSVEYSYGIAENPSYPSNSRISEYIVDFQVGHTERVRGLTFVGVSGQKYEFRPKNPGGDTLDPPSPVRLGGPIIGFSFMISPVSQETVQIAVIVNACACSMSSIL